MDSCDFVACKGSAGLVVIKTRADGKDSGLGMSAYADRGADTCVWPECRCKWRPSLGCLSRQGHPAGAPTLCQEHVQGLRMTGRQSC